MRLVLKLFVCLLIACPAVAAPREQILFEVSFDMDQAGTKDRAALVLVGTGQTELGAEPREFHMLGEGQHADLLIYLDHGDGVLDITKQPTLRKEKLISYDGLSFVMPMTTNSRGSLNVVSSNGFGNTFNTTEKLTIVYRGGKFVVAGWAQDFYNSREDKSIHCSVNHLAGKALKRVDNGKNVNLKGVFKPIDLPEWTAAKYSELCGE